MILIIDNYDSFVFNLARYVSELGKQPYVVRNDKLTLPDIQRLNPSHIILSPGPCTPSEAGICIELVRKYGATIPMLGVCLGHQAIAQACGGKVVRAPQPKHGKADLIFHHEQALFLGLPNPLQVGRYHSLLVEAQSLPTELIVTATTQELEIMAFQHQSYPLYAVQFHPESILTPQGAMILQNFLAIEGS